jgi:outer membrane biosynthesis protein TonB
MRVHTGGRVSRRPLAIAIGISVGLHLLIVAAVLFVRPPENPYMVKRGEPLFVELPKAEEPAARGGPQGSEQQAPNATPAPPARPTPKAQPQPQPRVAARPPQPSPAEPRAPQPQEPVQRAPEPPPVASAPTTPAPPAAQEPEAPDGLQASRPPAKSTEPAPSEPARSPEAPPRDAAQSAPPQPRVAAVPPSPPLVDSRAALRRGGPGGAGGAGEGWAGIEGEPIPLDSKDPKYNDYLERVRRMIKEKWGYPCIKDLATGHCDYKSARLVIVFGILKDGRVPTLEVAQQSGYAIYDDYATNAIRLAQPFPPVPPALLATAKSGSAGIKIVAAFQYVLVESSLTNILR